MIHTDGKTLVITLQSTDPKETHQQLIKDISVAVRWYASSEALHDTDKEVLYRLAHFQQQLLTE